ncbi:hypothetical protein [Streptomyces sp. NPDC058758]|uniref:hypothetical protein n=1 Tax=Streptomyces sp. NPDC058758 TaxID=3346627 RepID=UPI003692D034
MDLDRTPAEIARAAGEQIRALNHRTLTPRAAFTYPSEIQDTVTGLAAVLLGLPQALDQIHQGLDAVNGQQRLYAYNDTNVDDLLDDSKTDLLDAVKAVQEASLALQHVVNRLAYVGAIVPEDTAEAAVTD